jgi:GGDEF domain-containing protein
MLVRTVLIAVGVGTSATIGLAVHMRNDVRVGKRETSTLVEIPTRTDVRDDRVLHRMLDEFLNWLAQRDEDHLWAGFDQLLREMVAEHLEGTPVRCYHVVPGEEELRSLAQATASVTTSKKRLLGGVASRVVESGDEYVADASRDGARDAQRDGSSEERFDWVWPIRRHDKTIGLVMVGELSGAVVREPDLRRAVVTLVQLMWEHVAALEALRVARRTDRSSGVLNRGDFFSVALNVLDHAYRTGEPVVIATLTLEGLRALDDYGMWQDRDALIAEVGATLARRLRSDDRVGRFSDDRFVVLLRRLDGDLGSLIVGKILTAAETYIVETFGAHGPVGIRAGLAVSGKEQPALDTLLDRAFAAAKTARERGKRLQCHDQAIAEEVGHES